MYGFVGNDIGAKLGAVFSKVTPKCKMFRFWKPFAAISRLGTIYDVQTVDGGESFLHSALSKFNRFANGGSVMVYVYGQLAVRLEHTFDFLSGFFKLVHVVDGIDGNDDIERVVAEWHCFGRSRGKGQLFTEHCVIFAIGKSQNLVVGVQWIKRRDVAIVEGACTWHRS